MHFMLREGEYQLQSIMINEIFIGNGLVGIVPVNLKPKFKIISTNDHCCHVITGLMMSNADKIQTHTGI